MQDRTLCGLKDEGPPQTCNIIVQSIDLCNDRHSITIVIRGPVQIRWFMLLSNRYQPTQHLDLRQSRFGSGKD